MYGTEHIWCCFLGRHGIGKLSSLVFNVIYLQVELARNSIQYNLRYPYLLLGCRAMGNPIDKIGQSFRFFPNKSELPMVLIIATNFLNQ